MSKSKRLLLEAGRELFWRYGFRRVSVDEICRSAGVSKMTFYRYFPDKTTLAKTVFSLEVKSGMHDFRLLMKSDKTGAQKIAGMLHLKSKAAKNISRAFLLDFYQHNDTGLREFIEKLSAEAWQETLELMIENQQSGVFRADINLKFLLALSQKLMDMIHDEQLIAVAGGAENMVIELSKLLAFGVAGHMPQHQ
jgi:AcrR family transcriptional regulator